MKGQRGERDWGKSSRRNWEIIAIGEQKRADRTLELLKVNHVNFAEVSVMADEVIRKMHFAFSFGTYFIIATILVISVIKVVSLLLKLRENSKKMIEEQNSLARLKVIIL